MAPPLGPTLAFTEAIKDSPSFSNFTATFNALWSELGVDDATTVDTYRSASDALAQIVHLQKSIIEYTFPSLRMALAAFQKNELAKVNETRSHFENLSGSLSEALSKKASIHRNKVQELADAKNSLTAVGTCFAHTSLDYVAVINTAHARKAHIVLEPLWTFVKEYASFFRKGYVFFFEKPEIRAEDMHENIAVLKSRAKVVERKMQDRHQMVPKEIYLQPAGLPSSPQIVMEGYLFKRASNTFKTWNRRWFMIQDDKLLYCHKSADAHHPTVMENNLKLCLVRAAPSSIERTCCFELVTPTKNHLLQADSEALCQAWIRAISRTIQHLHEDDNSYHLPHLPFESKVEAAFASNVPFGSVQPRNGRPPSSATPSSSTASLRESTTSDADPPKFGIAQRPHAASSASSSSTTQESQQFYEELRHIPGNDVCADCGSRNPKWASINLGVLLCIECCGVHRSLGVHLSKVRSLTMDSLEPEQRKVMLQLGNHKVNAVYLAFVPQTDVVPPPARDQSSRLVRESWITAKYVEKRFTRPDFQRAFQNVKTHGRSSSAHDMSTYGIMHYNTVANLDLNGRAEDDWPTTSTSTTSEKATVSAAMLPGIIAASAVLDVRQPAANRLSRLSSGSETNLDASGKELRASVSSHASIGMHPPSESEILEALETGNLEKVLSLMARGFDLNSRVDGTYPLHIAVSSHQTTLIEFLLLNGAKINAVDGLLNSALHVAAMRGHTIEVYQLLKRKADTELRNLIGHTPLDLAVEAQHADIVTLLRLHDMREDDDFNTSQTVDEFISDLASRQKLNAKEDNQA